MLTKPFEIKVKKRKENAGLQYWPGLAVGGVK